MLIAFEGTGQSMMDRADFSFQNGFIHQFVQQYAGPGRSHYFAGPSIHGGNCGGIMNDACRTIEAALRFNKDEPINIVGYSRGGFISVAVARYVGVVHKKTVNFLGLFDAVKMTYLSGPYETDQIPGNVRYVCHAFRNPRVRSRTNWGNTAWGVEAGVWQYHKAMFMASHAGMGGWPSSGDVTNNTDEWRESQRAGMWMTKYARQFGVRLAGLLAPRTWHERPKEVVRPQVFPQVIPGVPSSPAGMAN
jgi:hypothetical protein